jgi:5-formyltetrahydrofolate cyclo-ligase
MNQGEWGEVLCPPAKSVRVIPSILLVPGVAFSRRGQRLGRGRGFYDRYLESFKGLKIGICFEEQLVDSLPVEPHDISVDAVVTDGEIVDPRDVF